MGNGYPFSLYPDGSSSRLRLERTGNLLIVGSTVTDNRTSGTPLGPTRPKNYHHTTSDHTKQQCLILLFNPYLSDSLDCVEATAAWCPQKVQRCGFGREGNVHLPLWETHFSFPFVLLKRRLPPQKGMAWPMRHRTVVISRRRWAPCNLPL